jgi:hypothetical protein
MPDGRLAFPRRHPKAALVGVGLTSLALLATVLVTKGWTEGGNTPDPHATWGAPSGSSTRPSPVAAPSSDGSASAAVTGVVQQGVLRSLASGLCLDISGGRVASGAGVALAVCSTAGSQQWSYDQDGLLRSLTDPGLCLASDTTAGTVTLAGCLVHAGEVHYDLTVRGELLLRWSQGLAVAPEDGKKGARVVVVGRDGSAGQQWVLESAADSRAAKGGPTDNGDADEKSVSAGGGKEGGGAPDAPEPPEGAPPGDVPPPPADLPQQGQQQYAPRAAQVACCGEPAPEPEPSGGVDGAVQPLTAVGDAVEDVVGDALGTVAALVPSLG